MSVLDRLDKLGHSAQREFLRGGLYSACQLDASFSISKTTFRCAILRLTKIRRGGSRRDQKLTYWSSSKMVMYFYVWYILVVSTMIQIAYEDGV